jgi:hypothetical protein
MATVTYLQHARLLETALRTQNAAAATNASTAIAMSHARILQSRAQTAQTAAPVTTADRMVIAHLHHAAQLEEHAQPILVAVRHINA